MCLPIWIMFAEKPLALNHYRLIRIDNHLLHFGVQLDPSHLSSEEDEKYFSKEFESAETQSQVKQAVTVSLYEYTRGGQQLFPSVICSDKLKVTISLVRSQILSNFHFVYKNKPLHVTSDRIKFEVLFLTDKRKAKHKQSEKIIMAKKIQSAPAVVTGKEKNTPVRNQKKHATPKKESAQSLISWWKNNFSPEQMLSDEQYLEFHHRYKQLTKEEKQIVKQFLKKEEERIKIHDVMSKTEKSVSSQEQNNPTTESAASTSNNIARSVAPTTSASVAASTTISTTTPSTSSSAITTTATSSSTALALSAPAVASTATPGASTSNSPATAASSSPKVRGRSEMKSQNDKEQLPLKKRKTSMPTHILKLRPTKAQWTE